LIRLRFRARSDVHLWHITVLAALQMFVRYWSNSRKGTGRNMTGKYDGPEKGDPPPGEAENFYRCEACGGMVDRRNTRQVYDHLRPLPHVNEIEEN